MPAPGDERFGILFDTAPIGIAFISLDGILLAVNPAACRLWGGSERDLVGSAGPQVVHPEDREQATAQILELLAGRVAEVRAERRYVQPDGTVC
jgi:PAS domain S-box-containing protein